MRATVRLLPMLVVAAMLCVGQGCPGPTPPAGGTVLPGSSTIDELLASDAIVGQTGLIRVALLSPVATDTEVTLTSSNTAVAVVPVTAVIPQGGDTADVVYNAVSLGGSLITAQIGTSTQSISISVVPSIQLSPFSSFSVPLAVGTAGETSIDLNIIAPSPTAVQLTSSNPAVASVPATVTVSELYSSQRFPIQAVSPGIAIITATLGTSQQSVSVAVIAASALASISTDDRVLIGTMTSVGVNLNAYTPVDRVVTLTSSNPAVLAVPPSIIVPAGSYYTDIIVPALAEGRTTLTASLDGATQSSELRVVSGPSLQSISATSGRVQIGAIANLYVSVDTPPLTDVLITLTPSNPAVVSVPPSATITAGRSYLYVPLTGLASGTTLVTATLGSNTQGVVISVVASPSITNVHAGYSQLQVGAAGSITLSTDAVAATDTLVTITADTPGILSTPSSLFLPAGTTYGSIPVLGIAPGSVNLTITAFGSSRPATVTVVNDVHVATVQGGLVGVGKSAPVMVALDALPASETVVTLVSGDVSKLTVQPTLTIPAGSTSAAALVTGVAISGPVSVSAIAPVVGPPISNDWIVIP